METLLIGLGIALPTAALAFLILVTARALGDIEITIARRIPLNQVDVEALKAEIEQTYQGPAEQQLDPEVMTGPFFPEIPETRPPKPPNISQEAWDEMRGVND